MNKRFTLRGLRSLLALGGALLISGNAFAYPTLAELATDHEFKAEVTIEADYKADVEKAITNSQYNFSREFTFNIESGGDVKNFVGNKNPYGNGLVLSYDSSTGEITFPQFNTIGTIFGGKSGYANLKLADENGDPSNFKWTVTEDGKIEIPNFTVVDANYSNDILVRYTKVSVDGYPDFEYTEPEPEPEPGASYPEKSQILGEYQFNSSLNLVNQEYSELFTESFIFEIVDNIYNLKLDNFLSATSTVTCNYDENAGTLSLSSKFFNTSKGYVSIYPYENGVMTTNNLVIQFDENGTATFPDFDINVYNQQSQTIAQYRNIKVTDPNASNYPAIEDLYGTYTFNSTFTLINQELGEFMTSPFVFEIYESSGSPYIRDFLAFGNSSIKCDYYPETGELVIYNCYFKAGNTSNYLCFAPLEGGGYKGSNANNGNPLKLKFDEDGNVTIDDFDMTLFSANTVAVANYRDINITKGGNAGPDLTNPFGGEHSFTGTLTEYTYDGEHNPVSLTKKEYTVNLAIQDELHELYDGARQYVAQIYKFDQWEADQDMIGKVNNLGKLNEDGTKFSLGVDGVNGVYFDFIEGEGEDGGTSVAKIFGHADFYEHAPTFLGDSYWDFKDEAVVLTMDEQEEVSLDTYYVYESYDVANPTETNADNVDKYYALDHKWEPVEYVPMAVTVTGEGNKDAGSVVLTIAATNIENPTYDIVIKDEANNINQTVSNQSLTDGKYTFEIPSYDSTKDYNLTATVTGYELGFKAAEASPVSIALDADAPVADPAIEISNAEATPEDNKVTITFDVELTDIDIEADEVTFKVAVTDNNEDDAEPFEVPVDVVDNAVSFDLSNLQAGDYDYDIVLIAYDADGEEITSSEAANVTFTIEANNDDDPNQPGDGGEGDGGEGGEGDNNGGGEGDNGWTGIDNVNADENARYFTLQGHEVKNPVKGIYIKVVGNNVTKVNIR